MRIEQIAAALADRRIDKVMKATGLSRSTIIDIRDGRNKNPTLATIAKLAQYLGGSVPPKAESNG
jgi:transcriptional regulator with XRE-family HTH domain